MNITLPRAVIEQALEALEWEFGLNPVGKKTHETITALRTALEQPEQEPVAWVYPEGLEALKSGKPWTAYGGDGSGLHPDGIKRIPFYTTPPQPKPLSDDEIQAIWEKTFESGASPNTFARAIEAAHSRQDDYELLGYVELGGYFGVEQARKNGLSGVPVAIYVEPLLPEPNNDLTQMVPIYIKPAKEKPTT